MFSEIQTMNYLRNKTDIPIPAIFHTNTAETPVGVPFTIQELVKGRSLVYMWDRMSRNEKIVTIQKLGKIMGKLYSLKFDSYGSIIDGAVGVIGPLVDPIHCLHHPYPPMGMAGPWSKDDPFGVFVAFATREYNWLKCDLGKTLYMNIYEDGRDAPLTAE